MYLFSIEPLIYYNVWGVEARHALHVLKTLMYALVFICEVFLKPTSTCGYNTIVIKKTVLTQSLVNHNRSPIAPYIFSVRPLYMFYSRSIGPYIDGEYVVTTGWGYPLNHFTLRLRKAMCVQTRVLPLKDPYLAGVLLSQSG